MSENSNIAERFTKVLTPNYRAPAIAIIRGEGCKLYDAEGREYLDMMGGIATVVLGHCHPRIVSALENQAHLLWHTSNLFASTPQIELAEILVARSFADRVFFANSGAEANEAALKLARLYHREHGRDRYEIIAFEGGFHGRTLFTVSATGTPAYWKGFEPMVPGVHHAPFGDAEAVRALCSERTAAIIIEPIQGESGVRPAPAGFLAELREIADENGCLLIVDEVQTGMGRTGTFFAHEPSGVTPDIVTVAKALGNGIPIGAMLTREKVAKVLGPGTHGSTFGGNPLAAACAKAVMDELFSGGILESSREVGLFLGAQLEAMQERLSEDKVVDVRGIGHLRAVELPVPAAPIIDRCRERGLLVIGAGERNIRLAPPLVIRPEEVEAGIEILEEAIRAD
ncbi:MAG: acetylornithine transaminase [Myxococcota bacterium]|nr:acetylornithine transaminase [Myxococcota bacterium]